MRVDSQKIKYDGNFIVAYREHFVAVRRLDGVLQINWGHRTHAWMELRLSRSLPLPVWQCPDSHVWHMNTAAVDGVFEVQAANMLSAMPPTCMR